MESLHRRLLSSSKIYAKWHNNPAHQEIHWIVFVGLSVFLTTIISGKINTQYSSAIFLSSDIIPPSIPTGLTSSIPNCGQVDLSWQPSTDEVGGSGVQTYVVTRLDTGGDMFRHQKDALVAADRVTFTDTNYLRSNAELTYTVVAQDSAGNKSLSSNSVSVTTPSCQILPSENVVADSYTEPLGKSISSYGNRSAIIYTKRNASLTLDTWLYLRDSDTGQSSRFLLHNPPNYKQIETDYLLSSSTELWALSYNRNSGGNVLVSKYKLNGSPIPTSATLVSAKSLGDSGSVPKSMIRLKSGALVVAWNQDQTSKPDGSVDAGIAYLNTSGIWTILSPINITAVAGGGITLSRIAIAQHPADNSIWVFQKRDSFHEMSALHFTERSGGLNLDWINNNFISQDNDGINGPETEFPYLSAITDPTRNAILLAYQNKDSNIIYVDRYNGQSGIFVKEGGITISQIMQDGSKSFIAFPDSTERIFQFGFSVLPDGNIWLSYPTINHNTLTWNQTYARRYAAGVWSSPSLAGYNFNYYSGWDGSGHGDPGFLVANPSLPQISFVTPDEKIHIFNIDGTSFPSSSDTIPPTIPTGLTGSAVTPSQINLSWAVSTDNVGVAGYKIFRGGVLLGTTTANNYSDYGLVAATTYSYAVSAFDLAGNSSSLSTNANVTTPSIKLTLKSRVKTTSSLNVRSKATTKNSGKVMCVQTSGAQGIISAGSTTADGYVWWKVDFDTGCDGWVVQNYLQLL